MRYVSTRGGVEGLSFCDAVMMGLAADGGLLVPAAIPDISQQLDRLVGMSYQEIASYVMGHFIDDIPSAELESIIRHSYETFDDPKVTPLVEVDDVYILELFHGPTLAFKDIALQFLGNVFEYVLKKRGGKLNIVGATSGDTGSAAIAGVRGKDNINIFVMFPEGRTSALQEKQMTTVLDDNVRNLAIQGSFDDCQSILKDLFNDLEFKDSFELGAVNSVNWARILAQVVYYFSTYVQLGAPERFQVSVPTGNFGNIFAGYVARSMGLPIEPLVLATNQNDILHRFFSTGKYERGEVHFTQSPAMDIQVASNFERYLYFKFDQDPEKVKSFMSDFVSKGVATTNLADLKLNSEFVSGCVSDQATLATVKRTFDRSGYLLDPHTAVAVQVGLQNRRPDVPLVCLSSAHPAKFEENMRLAIPNIEVRHPALEAIKELPERKALLNRNFEEVKNFIITFNSQSDPLSPQEAP